MSPTNFKNDSTKGPDTCPKTPPSGGDTSYGLESCTINGCEPGIPIWGLWDDEKNIGCWFDDYDVYKEERQNKMGLLHRLQKRRIQPKIYKSDQYAFQCLYALGSTGSSKERKWEQKSGKAKCARRTSKNC